MEDLREELIRSSSPSSSDAERSRRLREGSGEDDIADVLLPKLMSRFVFEVEVLSFDKEEDAPAKTQVTCFREYPQERPLQILLLLFLVAIKYSTISTICHISDCEYGSYAAAS